jgi:hypothetical protein
LHEDPTPRGLSQLLRPRTKQKCDLCNEQYQSFWSTLYQTAYKDPRYGLKPKWHTYYHSGVNFVDPDNPGVEYTEVQMNGGIREDELRAQFDTDKYHVLIVAEKFQTGFDQPLLHTMYVDKKLSGVHAV